MSTQTYEQQARLFAALAHPVRLRMLEVLAEGEACVCHFSALLQLRQAYVSQQLATLKEAGLISDKKDGLYVYYCLTDKGIVSLLREARKSLARLTGDDSWLHPEARLARAEECACPKCQTNHRRQTGRSRAYAPRNTKHVSHQLQESH